MAVCAQRVISTLDQYLPKGPHPAFAVAPIQFRDLRAKAGTDKADATDMREAQQQLGHKSVKTTEIYLRARAGEKVTPTK